MKRFISQRIAKLGLWLLVSAPILVAIAPSVSAQNARLAVTSETAAGTYESNVYQLTIGTNQGTTLSFIPAGIVIQQIWLDDPTRVSMLFDGCLPSSVTPNAQGRCGQDAGAQIVRLRQLSSPIDFPENIAATGRNPMLTVIGINASGAREVYQFELVLNGGTPPFSLVEVIPSAPPSPAQFELITREYQREVLSQLSQGLAYAEAQHLVDQQSQAYENLRSMIALMEGGTAFDAAMQQTNTPRNLVSAIRGFAFQNQ
ncbi:MAG: hypothetical protein AAF327_09750 [Cyanobacteria bacterium P01_A01_bin.37]